MKQLISFIILITFFNSCNQTREISTTDFYVSDLTLMEINDIQTQDRDKYYSVLFKQADDSIKLLLTNIKTTTEQASKEIFDLREQLIQHTGGYDDYHSPKFLQEKNKVQEFFLVNQNGIRLKESLNKLPTLLKAQGFDCNKIALDIKDTPYFQSDNDKRKLSFEEFLFKNTDLAHSLIHIDMLYTKILVLESQFLNSELIK